MTPDEIDAFAAIPGVNYWLERHPGYRRQLAGPEADYWRARILAKTGAVPEASFPSSCQTPRVGMVVSGLLHGGVGEWARTFPRLLDTTRLRWAGIAGLERLAKPTTPYIQESLEKDGFTGSGPGAVAAVAAHSDVLLAWGVPNLPLYLPRERRPAIVIVSHAEDVPIVRPWTDLWLRQEADHYLAVSRTTATALVHVPPHKQTILPLWPDPEHYASDASPEAARERFGLPRDKRVLLWVGRFDRVQKRPQRWLQTLAHLPHDWMGFMVQGGWDDSEIRAMIPALGLADRVIVADNLPTMGDAYRAADVMLVPSLTEGWPMCAAEAIAAGLPVVMTEVGLAREHPEWVRHFPVDTEPAQIARILRSYIGNGTARISEKAARTAAEASVAIQAVYGLETLREAATGLLVRLARKRSKPRVEKGIQPPSGKG